MGTNNVNRLTELFYAIRQSSPEAVRLALANGASVHETDAEGVPALLLASGQESSRADAVVACLLAAGANANAVDRNGRTALINAVAFGRDDMALTLIRAGANPNVEDQRGASALARAVDACSLPVVRALLAAGARPDGIMFGHTALMMAAYHGRTEMVACLLEAGADWSARERDGHTAEMMAANDSCRDALRAWRERAILMRAAESETPPTARTADASEDGTGGRLGRKM